MVRIAAAALALALLGCTADTSDPVVTVGSDEIASADAPSAEEPPEPEIESLPQDGPTAGAQTATPTTPVDNPVPVQTPTGIAVSPTPSPLSEAVEPTPEVGVCAANRDNAGLEYTYSGMDAIEAVELFCGTFAPVETECGALTRNAWLEYSYDPDEAEHSEASEFFCGASKTELLESCELLQPSEGDAQKILKGTQSTIESCYVTEVGIHHFDSTTGPCAFLGFFNKPGATYWNSNHGPTPFGFFGYRENPYLAWEHTNCPELDSGFEHDEVVVAAIHLGPITYETVEHTSNTVPAFQILFVIKPRKVEKGDVEKGEFGDLVNGIRANSATWPLFCAVDRLSRLAGVGTAIRPDDWEHCP